METLQLILAVGALILWAGLLLVPWQPWRTTEALEADDSGDPENLGDVTVLIPARNEAEVIERTLRAVLAQGPDIRVILVNDSSTDGTGEKARALAAENLQVIDNEPLKEGWVGKLWALEQGRKHVKTPWTMLLDADVEIAPGLVKTLLRKARNDQRQFVSLMAEPPMYDFWEKLLMPAFVYFFKLLYPFKLANAPSSRMAAAAGGCVLMETKILSDIGGFEAIRTELIDDCALARRVKDAGHRTWLGLTHAARSVRPAGNLAALWNMVARTAFTQLNYSVALLAVCTGLMAWMFWAPALLAVTSSGVVQLLAIATLIIMFATYIPMLAFYRRTRLWALGLPLVGTLYLAMTWTSAIRYWRGDRSRWKGRVYSTAPAE